MSFLTWIVLGLIAGYVASKIVNGRGEGVVRNIILGIVGALFGEWIFDKFGAHGGVTGVNAYSILVAVVGSVILLFLYHAIRRIVHTRPSLERRSAPDNRQIKPPRAA